MPAKRPVKAGHLLLIGFDLLFIDFGAAVEMADHDSLFLVVQVIEFKQAAFGNAGLDDSVEAFVLVEGVGYKGQFKEDLVVCAGQVEQLVRQVAVVFV